MKHVNIGQCPPPPHKNPLLYSESTYKENKVQCKKIIHIGKLKLTFDKKYDIADYLNYKFEKFGYRVKRLENNLFEVRNSDIVIQSKSFASIVTAYEVICNTEYDFNIDEPFILIDIGYNIGITSLHFALNDNIKHIYGFEPFVPTYNLALNNLQNNPKLAQKIELFNYGLGNSNKTIEAAYDENLPGSMSTVYSNESSNKTLPVSKVEIKDVSDVLSEILSKHNEKIFLKLDAEGAEFEILPLLSDKGLLQKINVLVMEYHKKSPETIFEILSKNGFVYFYNIGTETGLIRAYRISENR